MDWFKGFIPLKDKKPLVKFKDVDLFTLEEVSKYDEYAGVLASDTIVIDIDNEQDSEKFMQIVEDLGLVCQVRQTTRGKHFYFKNKSVQQCFTGVNLACGIKADIKVGCKNSYAVLKKNGQVRDIIYDKFNDEEYDVLPYYFKPVKSSVDFTNLGEGDGRNQSLFNYILTLQANGFNVDQCKNILKLINKYVLKKPLPDSELDVICREEAFSKPSFYSDKTFLFNKFAEYLMNTARIVSMNNILYIYKDGVYINGDKFIEQEMIKNIPLLNNSKRKEVLAYLNLIVPEVMQADARYIAFNNGIYDIVDCVLLPFTPNIILTNKIPFDYVSSAYVELADSTLNKLSCYDTDIRLLLEEVIGYSFYRRNELRKSFFNIGDKSTGKSTFLEMVHYTLGNDNVSTLSLDDIGDRFRTAEVYNKLANIVDDIEDAFKGKIGTFKNLVSGSQITVERKGKDPFNMEKMYTKFFFSANKMPYFKDKAAVDRLIIVPFKAQFSVTDKDFDPYIKYKLLVPEVAEYLIKIGIEGLKRVLKNKGFTHSAAVDKEMEEYEEKNNPIVAYLKDKTIDDFRNQPVNDCYVAYCLWSTEEGFERSLGKPEFGRNVSRKFNLQSVVKSVGGKSLRIYTD